MTNQQEEIDKAFTELCLKAELHYAKLTGMPESLARSNAAYFDRQIKKIVKDIQERGELWKFIDDK